MEKLATPFVVFVVASNVFVPAPGTADASAVPVILKLALSISNPEVLYILINPVCVALVPPGGIYCKLLSRKLCKFVIVSVFSNI